MYLKKIEIRNIKCFSTLVIDFAEAEGTRLWTTIFGKNGLGKSTLLQAIGAILAGPSAVRELIPVAEGWVKRDQLYGEIIAELIWTEGDALPPISDMGRPKTRMPYTIRYIVTGEDPNRLPEERFLPERLSYTVPTLVPWSGEGSPKERGDLTKDLKRLQQTAYAEGKRGWLACGYGPFRRLSGGGQDADRILYSERISARFVTLFREDAALTNATEWLLRLHNTARENDKNSERALEYIKSAFAKDLLPEPCELIVNARAVYLKIGARQPVRFNDLSDGYRSMLAFGIDLMRWQLNSFPETEKPSHAAGVVLIDELDAHLHPDWQRKIGFWLREKFPKIQFIVATHSPFLAQVVDADQPELLRTSSENHRPKSNIVLKQTNEGVIADTDVEPVQGLSIDQILQTELFDMESLRSPITEKKLNTHEKLHRKKSRERLTVEEQKEYEQLNLWRENLSLLSNPDERQIEETLRDAINRQREELKELE